MQLEEKIKEVWMEGFWYERPVDYKEEWDKLYQAIKNSEAVAYLDAERNADDEDDSDDEGD